MFYRTLFCTLIFMMIWFQVQAQYLPKITRVYHNEMIQTIFNDLRDVFEVKFAGRFADTTLRITLRFRNATLEEALTKLLQPFPYYFIKYDRTYSIKYSDEYLPLVTGIVTTHLGTSAENVYVTISETNITTTTNSEGQFSLQNVRADAKLKFTSVNTADYEIKLERRPYLNITLQQQVEVLDSFVLTKPHNGIDTLPEITPGSRDHLNLAQEPRIQVATGTVAGQVVNIFTGIALEQNNLQIRTINTIYANRRPLIVLNGIPFDGDINSIDPNEIQSITVLKDAASTAQWGVRGANGVIAIQLKKSQFKQPFTTEFTSALFFTPTLNLYKDPTKISSKQEIEVESFLFDQGHYNEALADAKKPVPLVAQIRFDEAMGRISPNRARFMLDSLSHNDVLKELSKYFYRDELAMQYSLNIAGSDANNAFHLFAAYMNTTTGRQRNGKEQYAMNVDHLLRFPNTAIELRTAIRTNMYKDYNNNMTDPGEVSSYSRIADEYGNPLPVIKDNKESFLERSDVRRLLNWQYRPLEELRLADNITRGLNLMADAELRYAINKHFSAKAYTRLERRVTSIRNDKSIDSYFTRNIINRYTQMNGNTITYGVPPGNILDKGDQQYSSKNLGMQFKYMLLWDTVKGSSQQVSFLAGGDLTSIDTKISENRLYGYDPNQETSILPNFLTAYTLFGTSIQEQVPDLRRTELLNENYASAYIIANYLYHDQFALTGSVRADGANMFGRKTNNRFAPLYSTGVGWVISNTPFLLKKIPYLKVNITYGIRGNVFKPASGQPLIFVITDDQTNQTVATPIAPANPRLRYERSAMTNFGLECIPLKGLHIGVEYYRTKGTDLYGEMRTDPGTGFRDVLGNYAAMKGSGIELTVTLNKKWRKCKWESELGWNYVTDKITQYKGSSSSVGKHLSIGQPLPRENHSLYTVYSVTTKGLDKTGQLQGANYSGSTSDFNAILQSTELEHYLNNEGSSVPRIFGFLNNSLSWNGFSVWANTNFKLKYVLRKSSINYDQLFNNRAGHKDISARWKHSGDEFATLVPAMIYPANKAESEYYAGSDVLIEKADHIRLQNLAVAYSLFKNEYKWLPCKQVQLTGIVGNVGILWRANNSGIDPDSPLGYSLPRTYQMRIQIFL